MLNLFVPQTKVQKNRQVIRQTDERMAKYSRRGIISNFVVYTLCLSFGQDFINEQQKLALILTLGLFLITIARAYFLFRFASLYPKAPAAWRNKYFLVTLMGACWWGLIMASLTLVLDLQGIAPLMWLYTVIFFSSTAHAFAPYQKFLSIYQFLGIVPAASCAFFIGDLVGVLYGGFLVMFYWILNHQCELMGKGYWQHLEADYALARKTESLEEERRGSKASVSLSKEYLANLSSELERAIEMIQKSEGVSGEAYLSGVLANVQTFHKVSNKELEISTSIINIRHLLQALVEKHICSAELNKLELDTALSPVLPSRIVIDARRLAQIVDSMLKATIQQSNDGYILLEVEFVREFERSGELLISIHRQLSRHKRGFFQSAEETAFSTNLELILAKGLAEIMEGSLEIGDWSSNELQTQRLRVPVRLAEIDTRPEYHRLEYKGRSVLLIQASGRWLDQKRLELDTMGFDVLTAHDFKKGMQLLQSSVQEGRAIESVVYSFKKGDEEAGDFAKELNQHNELKYTHQFVICANNEQDELKYYLGTLTPMMHFVAKPSGIFEFEIAASQVFEHQSESPEELEPNRVLWIASGKLFDTAQRTQSGELEIDKVGDIKPASKLLMERSYKLVIVELTEKGGLDNIQGIRKVEEKLERETLLPIVGVCAQKDEISMLLAGADHCIAIESLIAGDTSELRYWVKGRNH